VERRLDDRIRILFGRLIAIDSPEEFESVASQLRAALSDHVERLRGQVQKYPKHQVTAERRSTDEKAAWRRTDSGLGPCRQKEIIRSPSGLSPHHLHRPCRFQTGDARLA